MDRSIKWFAWLAIAAGIALMGFAVRDFAASGDYPPSGLSCRALCGLSLIAAELLGNEIGQRVLAGLQLALGLCSAVLGVKLIKGR